MEFQVDRKIRLDKFLTEKLSDFSRSKIQKLIFDGLIFVNGKKISKASYNLSETDSVLIQELPKDNKELVFEKMAINVLYEEEDFIVIDKPYGISVHPTENDKEFKGTVVNAFIDKTSSLVDDPLRPGIVHRLDKDTSGVMVIAKTKNGYDSLMKQFKERTTYKSYLTLVANKLQHDVGIIDSPIGRDTFNRKKMSATHGINAKPAISKYKLLESFEFANRSLNFLNVEILTGRTHQIRVHLSAIGNPVIGDSLYGNKTINELVRNGLGLKRQFLHAEVLEFVSPKTGENIKIRSSLPDDLMNVLNQLRD